jgi:hypothetical protein
MENPPERHVRRASTMAFLDQWRTPSSCIVHIIHTAISLLLQMFCSQNLVSAFPETKNQGIPELTREACLAYCAPDDAVVCDAVEGWEHASSQ